MPQRIITIFICSLCASEFDAKEKVKPYQVMGGGRGTLSYDICDTCEAAEPFASLLAAGMSDRVAGRKPKVAAPPPEVGEKACEWCGEVFSAQGMGVHQSLAHNVKSKTAILEEARGSGPHKCPDCGFGAGNPQGLGAHRRVRHGVAGPKSSAAKKTTSRKK